MTLFLSALIMQMFGSGLNLVPHYFCTSAYGNTACAVSYWCRQTKAACIK